MVQQHIVGGLPSSPNIQHSINVQDNITVGESVEPDPTSLHEAERQITMPALTSKQIPTIDFSGEAARPVLWHITILTQRSDQLSTTPKTHHPD